MGTFDVTRSTSLIQSTSVYVQTRKRSQPTGGMATLALIALLITTLIVTCSTNSHDLITVFPLQVSFTQRFLFFLDWLTVTTSFNW